jgi:hypothetical protein
MNRSQRFIFCIPVLLVVAALALVRTSHAGDEWLPITPADLALKDNPANPGADAMILYRQSDVDESTVRMDGAMVNEYLRIKIFTQAGTRHANIEVPFRKEWSDIRDVRGRTIHSDGKIINFEGKPFEKIIEKRSGVRILAKTFTLPDAQPGSIIEYRYRLQFRPGSFADEEWILSSSLFTREGHFSIIPFESSWSIYPLYFRLYNLSTSVSPERQIDGTYKLVVHDVPGIEDEELMPPAKSIESRVEMFHTSNGSTENESPDHFWKGVVKEWTDEVEHFVGKKNSLAVEVNRTVAAGDSAEVKLSKLYDRAQQIRNLSAEERKTSDEAKSEDIKKNGNVEDVLLHGSGSGHQINMLYVGLVRAAGYEAQIAYLAPRTSNPFKPELENRNELSTDIVWARADGKEYFLDPGASTYPFNLLPWAETGTSGLRMSGKGIDKIDVPAPTSSEATIVRHAELTIGDDGAATGTATIEFTGQEAALRRKKSRLDDDTGRRKVIEDEIKTWLPGDATFQLTKLDNWEKNELPVHVEGTIKVPSFGSVAGHRVLVPAEVFVAQQSKAFQPAQRFNAINFLFPSAEVDRLRYTAPADYKIETLPAKMATNPASIVVYQLSTTKDGSTAEVQRHLTINAISVDRQYYGALRKFFNSVKSNDDNQIILQNAESAQK